MTLYIQRILGETGKTAAAKGLGVNRATLHRKLGEYTIRE
jgi:DNA-binding protein Fis